MTRDQIEIISRALDEPDNLDEWEYDFILTVADYDEDRNLTISQEKTLEKIGNKLD